jgi:hypothetical protein
MHSIITVVDVKICMILKSKRHIKITPTCFGSHRIHHQGVITCKGKGKAAPLEAWSGPEGSRKLRFPDFMKTAQDGGGKIVSLTHRPLFPPRKYIWYSFLLEAESTPGP